MTTTLRPAGPLQRATDGTTSRAYDVCVNSRPVGAVELGTMPGFGPGAGAIRSLRIDEADRGRGRGTVAALAAEEVLRGWGCDQVLVSVPVEAAVGLRMTASLGYRERSRNMVKRLGAGPAPVTDVVLRRMTPEEFDSWEAASREGFAQSWIDRGVPVEQARAKAEASTRENLPDGLATEGAGLHVAVRDGTVVGHLWTGRRELTPGEQSAFVYDIDVVEEQRGKGYGRALMLLAERTARDSGARLLGLHVFTGNTPAIRLYESLGYATTHVNSFKPLL
ncbi:GNAT family N-acetyltransferase [Streptomyces sp. SP18CS02]|uniref:GNAT family N-acetyltransferase n=1 Tax=Streptomyces sp. SP18CS02 TaxID=3002531 RepID=UPI002E79C069|nr:GNAT family N-acetyltransferase [Streptomyces sp. SP18CS02]MEE1752651.1 GNAT family N-acetyltransferase [Streptomyces sp. SP18CS02]